MEVTFHCAHCKQELAVDASAAGTKIQCPACSTEIKVPDMDVTTVHGFNPIAASAAAKIERHFSVPVHDAPSEILVKAPTAPIEEEVHDAKMLRIRIFRHSDCIEVGHDRYEEIVTKFLNKVGESNIVSINALNYTHVDIGSQKILTDYAIQIIYRA